MRYIFKISFCYIIWKINFNIDISCKTCKRLRKVLTHFYTMSVFLIQLLNELSYPFYLTYSLSPFLIIFSILNFCWLVFLHFFFIKTSSNWFTIPVTNNWSPRNCIFNFANNKNFFKPILRVSFRKNVFLFWNYNTIANLNLGSFLLQSSLYSA